MKFLEYMTETEGQDSAINFAVKHGLLPDKSPYPCIKCKEGVMRWCKINKIINLPYCLVCSKRFCRATVALGKNTILNKITFPVSKALRLIYFWLFKVSILETADQLQLKEHIVEEWFKTLMEVCAFVIINYTKAIGGPGHTVEVCSYGLSKESHRVWLFTGVDRDTGHNFVVHVEDVENEALWVILKNYVMPGTVLVTERAPVLGNLERSSGSDSLSFVLPEKRPRSDTDYHLDTMFTTLKQYVHSEMPPNHLFYMELYAYKFLYFNRDGFCNVPVSKIILQFLNDVRLAFPGYPNVNKT